MAVYKNVMLTLELYSCAQVTDKVGVCRRQYQFRSVESWLSIEVTNCQIVGSIRSLWCTVVSSAACMDPDLGISNMVW